jgi:hypothetical protein
MRIRIQQTLYKTVEELHAALDSDAAHLCLAISAMRGVLCHDLPNHSKPVQALLCDHDCIKKVKNEAHG